MELRKHANSYDPTTRSGKIISAIITIIGIGIVIAAFLAISTENRDSKQCTALIEAEFMGYQKDTSGKKVKYASKFSFEYEGKRYSVKSSKFTTKHLYEPGDVIKLYIDPESPEIWYDPNEKIDKTFIVIMFIVGIFTTLGGAFFLYVGLKYRPKEDWEG